MNCCFFILSKAKFTLTILTCKNTFFLDVHEYLKIFLEFCRKKSTMLFSWEKALLEDE